MELKLQVSVAPELVVLQRPQRDLLHPRHDGSTWRNGEQPMEVQAIELGFSRHECFHLLNFHKFNYDFIYTCPPTFFVSFSILLTNYIIIDNIQPFKKLLGF
jgi:hypothetical protein